MAIKNHQPSPPGKEAGVNKIQNLDMTMIKMKLMSEKGSGWPKEKAEEGEKWYKRFLILHVKYPDASIVPTTLIDDVWHQHILDTRKYSEDCQNVFGFYLHHFPYFGLRGEADAKKSNQAFEQTLQLFIIEFGESPVSRTSLLAGVTEQAKCQENCTGGDCSVND